ncbi:hypothetical protein [Cellulomonas sp. IC4_254]|uniref:hypothetical protein n=1 Tax=Cellulomonas sp. IC4_254 TaxID=2714040 RepID=UPI001423C480|nr:hypothetical protein [Cellulomonas sp. IC4_254]NHT17840.1 hypothetical protein [Cellulomonas sp. IC4_254]
MLTRGMDGATRLWVRGTGRRVDLATTPWLQGPVGDVDRVGDAWLPGEAERLGAAVGAGGAGTATSGLLGSLADLDRTGFAAAALAEPVRRFYERTSGWRLDAWVGWAPWAWPFGWAVAALFARRLDQLALPMRSLDLAHGMSSTVTPLVRDGAQVGALWLRRLRATGRVVFSGLYGVVPLPGAGEPAVRVTFPLPRGRLVVLLRPTATARGGLVLTSGAGGWGDPGAYLVVDRPGGCWARRIPVHERFHVLVDDEGVLRTDHHLHLGALPVLRLHYRLTEQDDAA